jgi:hypothetical protein
MRIFETGATRDNSDSKIDYDGFLSSYVLRAYGEYMLKHQTQADGKKRESDNWQKGIPISAYMKSMYRHFMDVWMNVRGIKCSVLLEEALVALFFNVHGMLHEVVKQRLNEEAYEKFQNELYDDMNITADIERACGCGIIHPCPVHRSITQL